MSIKSNELRVGNIVQRPKELRHEILDGSYIYFCVDSVMIRDCEHYKENWAFEGIPLDSSVLEKCAFLPWINDGATVYQYDIFVQGKNGARFDLDFTPDGVLYLKSRYDAQNMSVQALPHIKYLHQLQNLVAAITGTELQINL